jgi:hypothetical protein
MRGCALDAGPVQPAVGKMLVCQCMRSRTCWRCSTAVAAALTGAELPHRWCVQGTTRGGM